MSTSSYFQKLKNYIDYSKAEDVEKDESLQLSDVIDNEKKAAKENMDTASLKTESAPYTVDNNAYEKEQLKVNNDLEELNEQWTNFLGKDPYLQIVYRMMLLMIK